MSPKWEYVKCIQYVRQKTEGQRLIEDGGVNCVLMLLWTLQEAGWDWIH